MAGQGDGAHGCTSISGFIIAGVQAPTALSAGSDPSSASSMPHPGKTVRAEPCVWVKLAVPPVLSCPAVVYFLRLVLRNALRHRLRTILTIVGIDVAITAFGLL